MTKKNANTARGEVSVTVGGEKHVMSLNIGALAGLEEKFGKFEEMAKLFGELGLSNILIFLKIVAEANADDGFEFVPVSRMRADEATKALMDLMGSLPTDDNDVGDAVEKPPANRKAKRVAASKKTS